MTIDLLPTIALFADADLPEGPIDVSALNPEVVARLVAEEARVELGDSALGKKGRGVREPGRQP